MASRWCRKCSATLVDTHSRHCGSEPSHLQVMTCNNSIPANCSVSDHHSKNDLPPRCSFAVIADVHYADIDDGTNYTKTAKRLYRRSLDLVQTAVSHWATCTPKMEFILQLGDLIAGQNVTPMQRMSESALEAVRAELTKLNVPVYHLWGNHEFYNFSRAQLLASEHWLNSSGGNIGNVSTVSPGKTAFYHFSPVKGYRIVVLDVYEISMLGYDESSDEYQRAKSLLLEHNHNSDLNSPLGMPLNDVRFVQFNGGVSDDQLGWLDGVLSKAQQEDEVVIVAGHIPVSPAVSDLVCLVWNYKDILQTLHKYSCVLAYFAGHTHCFAYIQDDHGIHHVVFPGVIETQRSALSAHATVLLYDSHVEIVAGVGSEMCNITMKIGRS